MKNIVKAIGKTLAVVAVVWGIMAIPSLLETYPEFTIPVVVLAWVIYFIVADVQKERAIHD